MNMWICDCRRCVRGRLARRATFILGVVLAIAVGVLALGLLTGCAAETDPVLEHATPDDGPLTPDVACVADRPVCVEAIWCGGPDANDWPVCYGNDGMCMVRPVPAGEECFDGAIGRCDGKGACK